MNLKKKLESGNLRIENKIYRGILIALNKNKDIKGDYD